MAGRGIDQHRVGMGVMPCLLMLTLDGKLTAKATGVATRRTEQ
jgi:hypothetical protein